MDGTRAEASSQKRRRAVFYPKHLLSTIESALLGPSPPSPSQRIELLHAIRSAVPHFLSLFSYPAPKAPDRAQVQSKEVRLPDSTPISLDDLDVQIALKLSDDLNLNEIECVRLLICTNQEWALFGREPLEIYRLALGLWYTERRDLLTSLYTLLRAVLLDENLEVDLVSEIQKYLEDLLSSGLRQRLTTLIKELNRDEPAGLGGPGAELHMLDYRGALVERKAVVCRERLTLGHCLVFSVLVVRMSSRDVKDTFSILKDCVAELNDNDSTIKLQIAVSLLFSLVIDFISDALSTVPDKASILAHDIAFRREFHERVMAIGNNLKVEGFIDIVRLGWTVHLLLIQEQGVEREGTIIRSCMDLICSNNVFQFMLTEILQSAAYQNDDEDVISMYDAYLHKLMMCFLSHPLARDKVKEMKEKAMTALSPYLSSISSEFKDETNLQQTASVTQQPFISLLELVTEIYKREPELLCRNEDLWTFVNFAGEDHSNVETLVAFLGLLSALASNEEGASRVYDLLQGKTFRSVRWSTLFDCLSVYDQEFKQALQNSGSMLPDFQEGDAKALVAYLNVLRKVVENGNPAERSKWFPDIEPLFKLLSYENVPPYLKGALRDAISAYIQVSPVMKDTIWTYLEQYDLPVVVGSPITNGMQSMPTQVYDMRFELNEVEARLERYPSTISFLNLLNSLITKETNISDRGLRFAGIFRFVYDHVFGSFTHRAYADECEKWSLAVACLQHFQLILSMYNVEDEDVDAVLPQPLTKGHRDALETQLPVLELLKDFMSGRIAFRNVMGILSLGVNTVIQDRTSKTYGHILEKTIHLSLEILVLVFEKDMFLSDFWRPLYQPLDIILSQDHNQIVTVLEYIRYNFQPQVQQCAIKIMNFLSSRMVGLVQLLLKMGAAKYLVEDYAACLELRFEESLVIENTKDDIGILILQLLIDNISRPAPNVTHLLLKFDMDRAIERTILQPKFHYSCFKVILDNLDTLSRYDSNALLFEFGFQLLYELCLDPFTGSPTMELLSSKSYQFFSQHLETFAIAPLPKRTSNQALRISSLHQRAWLLKLLALELHVADMSTISHRETCLAILKRAFLRAASELEATTSILQISYKDDTENAAQTSNTKNRVLELLEIIQFKSPDSNTDYSHSISNIKLGSQIEDILKNPVTSEKGGIYYYSERGDRLIDLAAFHDRLWQLFNFSSSQSSTRNKDTEFSTLKQVIQQLLRWAWKYNKNSEEQAAQLHMLVSWAQLVEVTISRRMPYLEDRMQILFELLDSTLNASASPDCALKIAIVLSQVALTCMAKLRDERFLYPGGADSDNVTFLDLIMVKQLPIGACHSILFKLMMAILRIESSESLRRRQFALLLCYFQYCNSILDPGIPTSVFRFLLQEGEDDVDLQKIDREQADLTRGNFSILKKDAQSVLDVVIKDAIQGSEPGKAIALYVLDAFVSIDQERFILSQLQSRGFLRSCFSYIANFSYQEGRQPVDFLQKLYTVEAKLALLLRISHKYRKIGAEVLLSMGALDHLASSRILAIPIKNKLRSDHKVGRGLSMDADRQGLVITPVLRLVSSLATLVEKSDFFEVKNRIVREVMDFVKAHQSILDQLLTLDVSDTDAVTLEQIYLLISILSKVWPYEENDEYGFVQELFGLMRALFSGCNSSSASVQPFQSQMKKELILFQIVFTLSSYLYFLVAKKSLRLQICDASDEFGKTNNQPLPTLLLVVSLLTSTTNSLERASEERILLLSKIQDINELSRQEVDEIINMCATPDNLIRSDSIGKRRYIAMVEMCHLAGDKEKLIALALQVVEHAINILMIHFQNGVMDSCNDSERSVLCGKLISTLERLEQTREDKVGHSLKVFYRSVRMLKEMTIRRLAL